MAVLWHLSGAPFIDSDGDPYSGAKATFYESGTTTPLIVYQDGGLNTAHDSPVLADANGVFPAVFLPATKYKVLVTDADAAETIFSADAIDPPGVAGTTSTSSGDTDSTLLFGTGMLIHRYGTGTLSGWVRAAGRTIGDASSGATERANADTEDLFEHLWTTDSGLTVSSGRGSTAAGDFAAHKTITLPDLRSRVLIGLATMGNTDVGLIDDSQVDSSADADTLGATAGEATHTLISNEMPGHTHTATATVSDPGHAHGVQTYHGVGADNTHVSSYASVSAGSVFSTNSATTGISVAVANAKTGSDDAHNNIQPSMFVSIYIKL